MPELENILPTLSDKGTQEFDQGTQEFDQGTQELRTLANGLKNKQLALSEVWIEVKKGAQLLNIPQRTAQERCKAGKYTVRKVRGNGGERYEILLNSLPIEAQVRYWNSAGTGDFSPDKNRDRNDKVSDAAPTEKALARHDFLRLYTQASETNWGGKVEAKHHFLEHYNNGRAFPDLLARLGLVSYQTAERWRLLWEKAERNPDALRDNYHPTRMSSISAAQADILLKVVLSPNRLPLQEAIRRAQQMMRAQNIACGQSEITYRRFIQSWIRENHDLYIAMRDGEKALNDLAMPYIQRDRDKIESGDILVADGHTLNFEAIDPFTGKPKRMTLIGFCDFKSGCPTGFDIMPTENVLVIASALRKAILTMGFKPRAVYIDNGKAFGATYFTSSLEGSGISGLFERLGIKTVFAEPYHGQSKTIERFFGSFAELERRLPSYTGIDISHKPARMMRNEKLHKTAHERLTSGTAPDLFTITNLIKEWIAEYIQRPYQGGFYKGRAPLDIFAESLERVKHADDFEQRLIGRNELNYLMLAQRKASIGRNGVRYNNEWYWDEALYGLTGTVTLRVDFGDPDTALVYDEDDELICAAKRAGMTHPAASILGSEDDQEQLSRLIAAHRSLKKKTVSQAKALLNAGIGRPFPDKSGLRVTKEKIQNEEGDMPSTTNRGSLDKLETGDEKEESVFSILARDAEMRMAERKKKQLESGDNPIFLFEYEREAWLKKKAMGE